MVKKIELKIDEKLNEKKIEYILEKHLQFSRSLISKLKRIPGGIKLEGEQAKVIQAVKTGQTLVIALPQTAGESVERVCLPLDILYEDDDIIAVNKPFAMPSHPSRLHQNDTLANALKYYMGYAGHIITRLDKDTTGVLLAAKNSHAAALLTDLMKRKEIQKEYIAVVKGSLSASVGEINVPIKKEENSMRRIVSSSGKEANTKYEVLNTDGKYSLVRLIPITGRTHQLRVHMNHMGCPIYGDSLYGNSNEEFMCLHCRKISFPHPLTGEDIIIEAPVPNTWVKIKA